MPRKAVSPSMRKSTGRPVGRPSSNVDESMDETSEFPLHDADDVLQVYQGQARTGNALSSDDISFY